jgi:protein SCO1/2
MIRRLMRAFVWPYWPGIFLSSLAVSLILSYYLSFVLPLYFPEEASTPGTVVSNLRLFCLGWDAAVGTYRIQYSLATLLSALVMGMAVVAVWPEEVRLFGRWLGRFLRTGPGFLFLLVLVLGLYGVAARGVAVSTLRSLEELGPRRNLPLPEFELTDQNGRPFASSSLRGRVAMITFVYTNCPDACPAMVRRLDRLARRIRARPEDLVLVGVTLDPERDTPAAFREAMRRWGVERERWVFLTGDEGRVRKVWEDFLVPVGKKEVIYGIVPHANVVFLVDRQGRIAYSLNPLRFSGERLASLVRDLLKES